MAKTTKKGKKTWIKIIAPREFRNIEIGESLVYSPEDLIGKNVKVNLSVLLGDLRRQNASIGLKITEAKGSQVSTKITSFEVLPAHVKRMIRTLKNRVDDSFIIISKDKLKLRVKPIMLTRSKTANSVLTAIRKQTREKITKMAAAHSFSDLIGGIIPGRVQKQLRSELSKVYPISNFEIRKLELVNR